MHTVKRVGLPPRILYEHNNNMVMAERNQKQTFWREFLWLWSIAGTVSAVSLSLSHFPLAGLERQLLIPFHAQSTSAILIELIAQSSIHLAIAIGVGLLASRRVGLGAPLLEAWLRGGPISPRLYAAVIPILLTTTLIVTCTVLSNSSILHPNRMQNAMAAKELANSPEAAKLNEQIERSGLEGTKPYTESSLAISYLSGAIGGELRARLFELSVVVLLFVQAFDKPQTIADRKFVWAAILIVASIHAIYTLWMLHENTLIVSEVLRGAGLQLSVDPNWLVAVRENLPIFPPGVALGWLYSRHGVESAILASFFGAITTHWFINFVWIHFAS